MLASIPAGEEYSIDKSKVKQALMNERDRNAPALSGKGENGRKELFRSGRMPPRNETG